MKYAKNKDMLALINKAIQDVFHKPETPFVKIRAMDLLFDGLTINCSSQAINESAEGIIFCSELGNSPDINKLGDNILKFSLFGKVSTYYLHLPTNKSF